MKRRPAGISMVFFLVIGIVLLLYPTMSNLFYERNASKVTDNYKEAVGALSKEQIEEQLALAREYNAALNGSDVEDPFIPGSGRVLPETYTTILNIGGTMGSIEIPKIDVLLPIYHGTGATALENGVGHMENTAFPIGGEGNHCVLTGHRGMAGKKLFTDLNQLEVGDQFLLHILGETFFYRVDQVRIVEPENVEGLRPEEGADYITLVTCTPYAINSHRLLVRGERVFEEKLPEDTEDIRSPDRNIMLLAILLLLLLSTFIGILSRIIASKKIKRGRRA